MAPWPNLLPGPELTGYQINPADQTGRTDMEVGPARQRRRTAARDDHISVTWKFTDREMTIFRAWFDGADYAAGGSAWFNVTIAGGDGGMREREARFVGPYQATPLTGLNWLVSAKLETRGGELSADAIKGAVLGLVSLSGVYPALTLDFAGDKTLDSRITFSRASIGTYFDAAGILRTAVANEPRFDHDPITGESLGLLLEEAATNSFPTSVYASPLSAGSWVDVAGVTAPDGTPAKALVPNTTSTIHGHPQSSAIDISALAVGATISVELSAFTRDRDTYRPYFVIRATDNAAVNNYLLGEANGATGALTIVTPGANWSAASSAVQLLPNGWRRVSLRGTYTKQTGDVAIYASFQVFNGTSQQTYAGNGTSGVYLWGVQFSAQAGASYIPTSGSTVTRAADSATITGTNFSSWYNQASGTLVIDGLSKRSSVMWGVGNPAVSFAAGETMYMSNGASGNITVTVLDGGVSQNSMATPIIADGVRIKHAFAYATNDLAAALGGTLSGTDTVATIPTPTQLVIGGAFGLWTGGVAGSNAINKPIARLAYYPQRLPNADLVELTRA